MPDVRRHSLIAVIVAALALVPAAAAAERLPRVGVVVLMEVNAGPDRAADIADQLGAAVRDHLQADVISGHEVQRRLPPAGIGSECAADAACIVDLGKRLEADKLLLLVVVAVGEQTQLDITWADARTGDTVAREAITLNGDAEDTARLTDAAPRLLPELPRRSTLHAPELPRERGRHMTTGAWIAAGVGTVTLAGAVGLGLAARSEHADLEADPCAVTRTCDAGPLRRYALGADLLAGATVVAGATAVLLYLRSDASAEPPVAVSVSEDRLQVVLSGSF